MMRVKLYKATFIGLLLAAMPATSSAVVSPAPTVAAAATAQKLANLKNKGTAEIDRRTTNLNNVLTKLGAVSVLKPADKDALTTQVKTELTGLATLKTKLAADTDLATARTDVQSIVTDYRVYALMLPKVGMVASADRFDSVEQKLMTLHDKLATKVSPMSAADSAKLTDMAAKLTDAKTKTDGIVAQLLALQPTDYNANHTVLVNFRATEKTAHDDLVAARDDAKALIDSLKGAKASSSPSSSTSPSSSPAK